MADKAVKLTQFSRSMNQIKTYSDTADIKLKTAVLNEVDNKIEDAIDPINNKVIPAGGTPGQILAKKTATDNDTEWIDSPTGGSGTTNYNDLSNRPKINGITLSGDKSASDLGITEYDDTALDARVTAVETALTGKADASDIPDVSGKANTSDLATVATSGSYNDLSNKPTIPSAYDDSALTGRVSDLETDVADLKTNSASVTVDSTLSDTSENPVQNKVIKAALDGLSVSGVVVDTALSDTSENPVQNKVIKAALDDKADSTDIPDISGKANTADLAAVATSGAYSDLTGTPTIPEAAEIATAAKAGLVKPGSGLNITSDGTLVVTTPVDGNTKTAATYTVEYDASTHSLIRRKLADDGNGYDADFTAQTIELPDWSGEIATAKAEVESEVGAVAKAGAKNLLKYVSNPGETTNNGVTFTVNTDYSVTVNGTATANALISGWGTPVKLKPGKYIISGLPASDGATYRFGKQNTFAPASASTYITSVGQNEFIYEVTEETYYTLWVMVMSGNTVTNLTFYPMLRDASITDSTYQPYCLSNAQITQELSDTGWITPDPTNLPNYKYRRKNGYVTVTGNGQVGAVAAKTSKTLFELPVGFRPAVRIDSTAHLANGSTECACQLIAAVDGRIYVWANTAIADGTSICGSICFPV